MWHVSNPAGRLIVSKWTVLRTVEDAQAWRKAVLDLIVKVGHVVVCADWTEASILPPDVAPFVLSMLSGTNAHVDRVAVLLAPDHATFNLQAERLVRDAKNSARRTFRDRAAQLLWLGEQLTPAELQAAEEFLK